MDALHALARRHGLRVIEDAALVQGSQWQGRNVGAIGDLVTFSFHPNKNITSIEGGALVVNDDDEARRVEALRFHGITYLADRTRDVAFPGGKFNLPDVNARIGVAQLARLPEFLAPAPRPRRPLLRALRHRSRLRAAAAAGRRRRPVVEHVERAAAARPTDADAQGVPRRARSAGHRQRRIVRGAAPHHARPQLRLPRRRFPGDGAHRAGDGDAATAPGDDGRRHRSRLRRRRRRSSQRRGADRPASTSERPWAPRPVGRHPGVQRGGRPAGAVRAALSGARRARRRPTRSSSSTTAAATGRRRCCASNSQRRPDVTRVVLFNANYGQHMAIIAGFERCRGERVVTLDADLQNPPEEIAKLLAAMDAGARLRRRRAPPARGFVVAACGVAGDEPAAGAASPASG